MKAFVAIILSFLTIGLSAQQSTYPYPQPKPLTGNTPDLGTIRIQYSVIPNAYDSQYPAIWDTDIGGGLQSRTNAQDRANAKWLRLGAIVMDQTDRTYYGVDVMPDGTLAAYRPLFKLDGGGVADVSIYSKDGDIADPRRVNLNNNSLTFSGVGQYTINTTGTLIDTGPLQLYGDNTELVGRQSFKLSTPGVANGQVTNGWVLTLTDSGSGTAEWVASSASSPNGIVDTSIYLNDGGIAQNRTLLMNQHTLKFDGGGQIGTGIFSVENAGTARILANNIELTDYSTISISTPKTRAQQVSLGDTLLVTEVDGTKPVKVEFGKAADTSIYSNNGQLNGNRDVTGNGFGLTFRNLGVFTLASSSASINGQNGLFFLTPDVGNHFARDNQILTLVNKDSGQVEYRDAPATKNLYNTSDILTSDRKVTGGSRKLEFSGVTDFTLSGQNTILEGVANVSIKAPGLAAANPGYVLTLIDKTTGGVDYRPAESFYYTNGTLTSDRTVDAAGRMLRIQNAGTLDLKGQSTSVGGTTAFNLLTPNVNSRTASSGQVLTLADTNTGRVEFSSIVYPALLDTSLYNTNGALNGDRGVALNGKNIDWVGTGVERFQIYNPKNFAVFSATNTMYATNEFTWGTASNGKLKLAAPGMNSTANGKVLMVTDAANAVVDLVSPTNIYTGDGTLLGNRIIQAASKDLSVTNADEIFLQAAKLKLLTPGVKGGTVAGGFSLQLKDIATGEVEFGPSGSGTTGDGSIYLNDGALQADRGVTMGARHLDWVGNGSNNRFQIYNIGAFSVFAKTNDFYAPYLVRITAPTNFVLVTPKVWTSGAAALAGQVLTLNANGTSDFQALTPAGEDTSIYKGSGNLLGNTTVNGATFNLTFSGSTSFSADSANTIISSSGVSGTTTIAGSTQLRIQPPGYAAAATGSVLTKGATADGQATWQPLPAPPKTIYTGDGDLASSRTIHQNNLGLLFDGGGAGFFGVANQGTADIRASTMLVGGGVSMKISTPKIAQGQGASLINSVLTLKAADGTAEYSPVPGSVNLYNTSAPLTDNRDVGLAGKYLKFNGPGAVEFNSSGSPFSVSGASSVLVQGSSSITLSSSGSIKIQTPKAGQVVKPNVGDVLTYQAADATVEYVPQQNIYNIDGLLTTGANNQRRVNGNQKAFLFDNLVSHTVDAAAVYITGRNTIRLGTQGTIAGSTKQGYVLTSSDVNGTAEWQPITQAGATLYTANDSLKSPRTVTMGANSLTFQGSGVLGGAFSVNAASSLNLQSSGIASLEAASGSFLKIRTPKVTKGDGMVIPGMVLMMQGQDGTVEYETLPSNQNIYTINGTMQGGKRTITGNGQGIVWNGMGSYEMYASTHLSQASSAMYLQTPNFRTANNDGKKWVLTMQDPNTGRVEFETPPSSGLPTTQNTIYTASDNIVNSDRTVGGSGGVYGLTLGLLKHYNVNANALNETITGAASISATGFLQIDGGTLTYVRGNGPTVLGTRSRTGALSITTPLVQNQADANIRGGYVLTLSTGNTVEWAPPPTGGGGGGGTTIYTANDVLTSDRDVGGSAGARGIGFTRMAYFNAQTEGVRSGMTFDVQGTGNFTAKAGGATLIKGQTVTLETANTAANGKLYIKTPLAVTGGTALTDAVNANAVLTLKASTGEAEFSAPQTVSGLVEYYGTLTGTVGTLPSDCGVRTLTLNPSTPLFTDTSYKDFMRVTARVASGAGYNKNDQMIRLKVGPNVVTTTGNLIVSPGGKLVTGGDIQGSMVLEMIYDAFVHPTKIDGTAIAGETGAWVLLSFGIGPGYVCNGPGPSALDSGKDKSKGQSSTNAATAGSVGVEPLAQMGGRVITLTGADGSVEFNNVSANSGIIEYYGTTDITAMNPPNPAYIHMPTSTPMYVAGTTGGIKNDYPDYMRVTARAKTDVLNSDRQTIYFSIGNGDDRPLMNPLHNKLVLWDLRPNMIMEMIYDAAAQQWILLSFGLGDDSQPQLAASAAPAAAATPPPGAISLALPARPTIVSLVGVVDLASDLRTAPVAFKKLSTLGAVTVGDGKHADYFLTAFDPTVSPAYAVRSTIDTNKMWKALIAR